jgi:hypothetical protein
LDEIFSPAVIFAVSTLYPGGSIVQVNSEGYVLEAVDPLGGDQTVVEADLSSGTFPAQVSWQDSWCPAALTFNKIYIKNVNIF